MSIKKKKIFFITILACVALTESNLGAGGGLETGIEKGARVEDIIVLVVLRFWDRGGGKGRGGVVEQGAGSRANCCAQSPHQD